MELPSTILGFGSMPAQRGNDVYDAWSEWWPIAAVWGCGLVWKRSLTTVLASCMDARIWRLHW